MKDKYSDEWFKSRAIAKRAWLFARGYDRYLQRPDLDRHDKKLLEVTIRDNRWMIDRMWDK